MSQFVEVEEKDLENLNPINVQSTTSVKPKRKLNKKILTSH
jgi:hypothetical protein